MTWKPFSTSLIKTHRHHCSTQIFLGGGNCSATTTTTTPAAAAAAATSTNYYYSYYYDYYYDGNDDDSYKYHCYSTTRVTPTMMTTMTTTTSATTSTIESQIVLVATTSTIESQIVLVGLTLFSLPWLFAWEPLQYLRLFKIQHYFCLCVRECSPRQAQGLALIVTGSGWNIATQDSSLFLRDSATMLLGTRTLLPGAGITTRNNNATSNKGHRY